jgi:hypothetical protein
MVSTMSHYFLLCDKKSKCSTTDCKCFDNKKYNVSDIRSVTSLEIRKLCENDYYVICWNNQLIKWYKITAVLIDNYSSVNFDKK